MRSDANPVSQDLVRKYSESPLRMFEYRFIKFEWNASTRVFDPIKFNCELTFDSLREKFTNEENFYTPKQREFHRMLAGPCEIIVPKKNIGSLLIDEILNPFYIF